MVSTPVEPLGEKNIDSATIEPNSATEHAATTNVPACVSRMPASFSTGTTIPSDVADRMIASSSGSMITSVLPSGTREPEPDDQRRDEADEPELATAARAACRSRARGRRGTAGAPRRAGEKTVMTVSSATQSSSAGPITIPAAISSTDDGMGSDGTRPRSSGTATATTITIMTSSKARPRSGTDPTVPARSGRTIDAMALTSCPDAAFPTRRAGRGSTTSRSSPPTWTRPSASTSVCSACASPPPRWRGRCATTSSRWTAATRSRSSRSRARRRSPSPPAVRATAPSSSTTSRSTCPTSTRSRCCASGCWRRAPR